MAKKKEKEKVRVAAVSGSGTIKACTIKPECADLRFDGLNLTVADYERVAEWVKHKELLVVTMKPAQTDMFQGPSSRSSSSPPAVNGDGA